MNTELNSLLSDFKNQLNIPEHELQSLRGFFNFLRNRDALADDELIPYGMLVQYDEEESLEIFKQVLKEVPDKLETTEPYRIFTVKEDKYYNLPIAPDRRDILVITDCSEDDSLKLMMQRFDSTPEVVKLICAPSSVVENRFKKDDHFFYRMLSRHVHLEKLRSSEITGQFLSYMNTKGYTVSQDFVDEIGYYIDSIYDEADFRNRDFVLDLMRRIELQMEENEGILAYRKGLTVDNSFIPYSKKVNLRREQKEEEQKQAQEQEEEEQKRIQAETDNNAKIDKSTQTDSEDKPQTEDKPASKPERPEVPATPNKNETHVQTHKPSEKIYNVLLLALSTFNGDIRKTEFTYDSAFGTIPVTGRYQLDPVPIMLDELLSKEDKNKQTRGTLDKIIMLCTRKTREKIEKVFSPEGVHYDISPEEYFKRQVRNFMRPDTPDEDLFTVIEVEPDSPYQGIHSVINTLRDIKKEHENQTLDLYLDTHGGIRGIQRIMEATVSLLKSEDIKVKDAFAVEFAPRAEKGEEPEPSRIISETENMKIYDFVSGVNEFFSCGRADTLMKYKKNLEDTSKQKSNSKNVFSKEEEHLVKAISDVATGIQWCSIPAFDKGIKDLQKIFPEQNTAKNVKKASTMVSSKTKNIEKSSYLDIYKTNIEKDYSTLLKKDHTILDEIDWCINKGFYQQALTLIESKICDLFITEWEILSFNSSQFKKEKNKYKVPNNNSIQAFSLNDLFNAYIYNFSYPDSKQKVQTNSNKNFWITDDTFNSQNTNPFINLAKLAKDCTFILNEGSSKQKYTGISSVFVYADQNVSLYTKGERLDNNQKSILHNNFKYSGGDDSSKQELIFKILVLHKTLKRVRNAMNHAASDSPFNISAINRALTCYMSWMRELERLLKK